ncbi:hypothetical protein EDD72_1091 [Tepidibacillus fermentans]|uniref:Uncharacterized protein n=1 Tax=Tepidibacillus fermentans TaxID=1281767 RepID=A0A4R3KG93_9BACI|nr:hypothetical protein [Tepidibacillus fermentans]TCS82434.1 hypothetical protein EDD72_1091 [Tepidibacillus fermentans]
MGSHKRKSSSVYVNSKSTQKKRTPRSFVVEEQEERQFPAIIPESFSFKNFDLVGKIDDMRSLTKELSIMARQLEMWMGVAYTVAMAFKDNGVLREVVKSLASIGTNGEQGVEEPKSRKRALPPPPLSFFQRNDEYEEEKVDQLKEEKGSPQENINIFEIMNNPAFKEIVSKLFLNNKKK